MLLNYLPVDRERERERETIPKIAKESNLKPQYTIKQLSQYTVIVTGRAIIFWVNSDTIK